MKKSSNLDKVSFDNDKIIKELNLTNNFATGYYILFR